MRGRGRIAVWILGLVGAFAVTIPSTSTASRIDVQQNGGPATVWFSGVLGETYNLRVYVDPTGTLSTWVDANNNPIKSLKLGCPALGGVAVCAGTQMNNLVSGGPFIGLGDGNDFLSIDATGVSPRVWGQAGNDTLIGSQGNDSFQPGTGADVVSGRGGIDAVETTHGIAPVRITLDGIANDGTPGEGDNYLPGIEMLQTSSGADELFGTMAAERFTTHDGDDFVDPDAGRDDVFAGDDDDRIEARDGFVDSIRCGPGFDTVIADPIDDVFADCEHVELP